MTQSRKPGIAGALRHAPLSCTEPDGAATPLALKRRALGRLARPAN